MKVNRKIIEIDEDRCDGCGNCVIACAEGALTIIDGKAKVISDNLCDGLGACIGDCPQDACIAALGPVRTAAQACRNIAHFGHHRP